jgi:translation initiation factor IF-1
MKEGYREFVGKVLETLPNTEFKVQIKDSEVVVLSHLSGKMRMNYIKILPGDTVRLEVSPYDPLKGRIIFREKK